MAASKGRKKTRKKKRQKLSNLKSRARYYFQRYIRLKAFASGKVVRCAYGCGKVLTEAKGCDAGHYLKAELYPEAIFDERNVYPVCKGCNIRDPILEYRKELIRRKGEDFVLDLEYEYKLNRGTYKWDRSFLEEVRDKYKELCKKYE